MESSLPQRKGRHFWKVIPWRFVSREILRINTMDQHQLLNSWEVRLYKYVIHMHYVYICIYTHILKLSFFCPFFSLIHLPTPSGLFCSLTHQLPLCLEKPQRPVARWWCHHTKTVGRVLLQQVNGFFQFLPQGFTEIIPIPREVVKG